MYVIINVGSAFKLQQSELPFRISEENQGLHKQILAKFGRRWAIKTWNQKRELTILAETITKWWPETMILEMVLRSFSS